MILTIMKQYVFVQYHFHLKLNANKFSSSKIPKYHYYKHFPKFL